MTLSIRFLALCLVAAPSLALASPPAGSLGSFHTTGGRTGLHMETLAVTPTTMKVRLTDPTKMSLGRGSKEATVVLHRQPDGSAARGWVAYEGTSQVSKLGVSMTIEDKALAGQHGLVGMSITENDKLIDAPKLYGVHYQLAGQLKK